MELQRAECERGSKVEASMAKSVPGNVDTPLGVLTGMDVLAISLVVVATLWIFFKPCGPLFAEVDARKMKPGIER